MVNIALKDDKRDKQRGCTHAFICPIEQVKMHTFHPRWAWIRILHTRFVRSAILRNGGRHKGLILRQVQRADLILLLLFYLPKRDIFSPFLVRYIKFIDSRVTNCNEASRVGI